MIRAAASCGFDAAVIGRPITKYELPARIASTGDIVRCWSSGLASRFAAANAWRSTIEERCAPHAP